MRKGVKVAVGLTALAAVTAVGAFMWSKSAQAATAAPAGGGGTAPSGGGGGGGGGNLPACVRFAPSTSDPQAVAMANALLNGSGPVPYQGGTSYQTMINGRLWQFNMGSGITNPGAGVEATVCVQTQ
jgi:hypothetical protein